MRYSIYNTTIEIVKECGGIDIKSTSDLKIIFATLDNDALQKLISKGCIIRKVKEIKQRSNDNSYNISDVLSVLSFPIEGFDGSDTFIAVIDSGILSTHEKLNGRVVYSENFTSEPDGDFLDHGTGVASIISDVCKANIIDLKVVTGNGIAIDEDVSLAIDRAIQLYNSGYSPLILNISLGDTDEGDVYNPIYIMCNQAMSHGIYIVAAAGNRGNTDNAIDIPASIPGVIAVGSLYYQESQQYPLLLCDYSSRGPSIYGEIKPDVVMPGHNIKVASNSGGYTVKSGTSFSAPVVSGILSLYMEAVNKGISPLRRQGEFIDRYLRYSCVKPTFTPLYKDNNYGYGMINGNMFLNSAIYGNVPVNVLQTSMTLLSLGFIASTAMMMVYYGR